MEKDLSNYRENYNKDALLEQHTPKNPMELFRAWFLEADAADSVHEANAMNLATIGLDGYPKNRIVLLKKFTFEGFVFYTNYQSEKGKALEINPNCCLSFFWATLERQVIIKGKSERLAENLSDGYFASRPDGSKLGAWASEQSQVVSSRDALDSKLKEVEKHFEKSEITRPKHWGGYLIKPSSIEFWQGRPNRMHDRIRYTLEKDLNWSKERLAP